MREIELFEMKNDIEVAFKIFDNHKMKCDAQKRMILVLRLRFFEEKTLEEISKIIKVNAQRVRQIEAMALRYMRKGFISSHIIGYRHD